MRGFVLVAAFTLAVPCAARAATFTYLDTEFANGDWEAVGTVIQSPGTVTIGGQITSGGNPGAYRQHTLAIGPTSASQATQLVVASFGSLFYDPSLNGAIDSLAISYDAGGIHQNSVTGMTTGFLRPYIRQGGEIFSFVTGNINNSAVIGEWNTYSHTSATATDWVSISDSVTRPDFSASGAPIQFGYRVSVVITCPSTSTNGCIAGSLVSGIDNFRVAVTSLDLVDPTDTVVPEPTSMLLLGTGLVGLAARRRRSRPRS